MDRGLLKQKLSYPTGINSTKTSYRKKGFKQVNAQKYQMIMLPEKSKKCSAAKRILAQESNPQPTIRQNRRKFSCEHGKKWLYKQDGLRFRAKSDSKIWSLIYLGAQMGKNRAVVEFEATSFLWTPGVFYLLNNPCSGYLQLLFAYLSKKTRCFLPDSTASFTSSHRSLTLNALFAPILRITLLFFSCTVFGFKQKLSTYLLFRLLLFHG